MSHNRPHADPPREPHTRLGPAVTASPTLAVTANRRHSPAILAAPEHPPPGPLSRPTPAIPSKTPAPRYAATSATTRSFSVQTPGSGRTASPASPTVNRRGCRTLRNGAIASPRTDRLPGASRHHRSLHHVRAVPAIADRSMAIEDETGMGRFCFPCNEFRPGQLRSALREAHLVSDR